MQVGTVLGQSRAALLEHPDVEVGVKIRRRAVKLLDRVAILGDRLGVCALRAEHRGQLLVQLARHAARLLAASEIAEEGLPLLLCDAVGHDLAQFARRALALSRLGEVVLRHFRRIRAVPRAVVGHHHRRLVAEVEIVVDEVLFAPVFEREIVRRILLFQPLGQLVERLELLVGQRHRAHAVIGQKVARTRPQIAQLIERDLEYRLAARTPLVVVFEAADALERRLLDVAALLGAHGQFAEDLQIAAEGLRRQFFIEQRVYPQTVGRVLILEIFEDALIERDAEIALAVHRFEFARQRVDALLDLVEFFVDVDIGRPRLEPERVDDLPEHRGLVCLAGVQFEAEIGKPYRFEPAVDDGQRRLLFGDEQHAAAADDVVGDDVGDRLRLAGARRSVQHKALAQTVIDRRILRRIGGDGQIHPLRPDICLVAAAVGQVERALGQFEPVVEKRAHDRMFAEFLGAVFDVVPKLIVGERQTRQKRVAEHLPALHVHRFALDARDHGHVTLLAAQSDRAQAPDVKVELTVQKLQKRGVEPDVVGVDLRRIGRRGKPLARHAHREEEEGRILELGRALLLPAQEAGGEIERRSARLLLHAALLAEETEQRPLVLLGVIDGQHALVGIFIPDKVGERLGVADVGEVLGKLYARLFRLFRSRLDGESLVAVERGKQILKGRRQQFDRRARDLEVEQRVAHVHVEQLALPLRDLARLLVPFDRALELAYLRRARFGRKIAALFEVVSAALSALALGERLDVDDARALDVDEHAVVGALQSVFGVAFRLLERRTFGDVVHADEREVVDPRRCLFRKKIGVVPYRGRTTLVGEEYACVPLAAELADDRVVSLALGERSHEQRKLGTRRDARLEQLLVRDHLEVVAGGVFEHELLLGDHAVTCGEIVAHAVARTVALGDRQLPIAGALFGVGDRLVDLGGALDERGERFGRSGKVALVKGEDVRLDACGHHRLLADKDLDVKVALGALVHRDEAGRRTIDVEVEPRGRAARYHLLYKLVRHDEVGL